MFILQQAESSYGGKWITYYSAFRGKGKLITPNKKYALTFDNLFEVKQLINKHKVKNYKIIEIEE